MNDRLTLVLGGPTELAESLIDRLRASGARVAHVVSGTAARALADGHFEADLTSADDLAAFHGLLRENTPSKVGTIVNLLPLENRSVAENEIEYDAVRRNAVALFNVCKEFQHDLDVAAQNGGGRFVNVTGFDGKFGLDNSPAPALLAAGTLGVSKAFRRESQDVNVKLIDVDPSMAMSTIAQRLSDELFNDDNVEIGITREGRWRIDLVPETRAASTALPKLPVQAGDVILITGGAYGITAEICKSLARQRPRLIIVGRSRRSEAEADALAHLDRQGLRSHLIAKVRSHGLVVVPADLEREIDRIFKDRQISSNLAELEGLGATVEYHSIDVRHEAAFGDLIDNLYHRFGRIDGVLHGAGVIRDKRIRDKSLESFDEVFSTKVESSLILTRKLRPDSLKYLVFFSSVAARFGNAGQADYSAANEFLNKLANSLDRQWPARVVAINWGPWDAGMVDDTLRARFAELNIGLISVPDGVRFLESELGRSDDCGAEVVICGSAEQLASVTLGA